MQTKGQQSGSRQSRGRKPLKQRVLAKRGLPAAAPFRKKWVRVRAGFYADVFNINVKTNINNSPKQ